MSEVESPLQLLHDPLLREKEVQVWVKRDDLLHPSISGNKWRKLKYNLREARRQGHGTLLTFGGAYSNHLAAVAAAGEEFGFQTIGLVRGEEHQPLNPTLAFARSCGMQLHYLDRDTYRRKQEPAFLASIQEQYGPAYMLPEGGTNLLAVQGCTEIVAEITIPFDYVCCACGTGGTLAGIIAGLAGRRQVIGFPALKGGEFLATEIDALVRAFSGKSYSNWRLETSFHFGGYARLTPELVSFIQNSKQQHQIQLEPVYTGKMIFGLFELIRQDAFPRGSTVVALHTGGLQGLEGMRERLGVAL
ncbi:pyridoxal-phosphate dependent enzyme [soil metagenome]